MKIGEKPIQDSFGIYEEIWNTSIPIPEDIPDVIVGYFDMMKDGCVYLNLMTGAMSITSIEGVARDNAFSYHYLTEVTEETELYDWSKDFFYLYHNKEKDVLVVYTTTLYIRKEKDENGLLKLFGNWSPLGADLVITKKADVYELYCFGLYTNSKGQMPVKKSYKNHCDILAYMLEDKSTPAVNMIHTSTRRSVNVLKEFFGQSSLPFVDFPKKSFRNRIFSSLGSICSLNMILDNDSLEAPPKKGYLPKEYMDEAKKYVNLTLPEIDKQKMFDVVVYTEKKEGKEVTFDKTTRLTQYEGNDLRFGIMQHVEGKENVSVLRIFDACLNTEDAFTTKRLSVENMDTFEAVRFFFSQEEICASRNFYGEWKAISLTDANDYIALKTIILPWSYEDSKGTIFSILAEYGAYESWFDKRKISSGSDWYIVNLTHKMKDLSYNAFTLLTNHFAKDIFNSPMQAVKRVFRDRLEHSSLDKCLRDILGVESILAPNNLSLIEWISPVKKRHIGIYEKVMEKYLVGGKYSEIRESERSLYYIDQFLDWASDDELDFVNGINNEQYQDLLDTWVKSRSTTMVSAIYDSDLIYCIKILVKLCGIKNLKEYITYMFKTVGNLEYDLENASFSDYEDARIVFSDYINMYDRLVSGGFVLKKPKWRFKKYSELARAHDDILYLTQIKEERKLEMKEESYKKIKESYEKYKYSEDKYAVVPPASLKSIVNEGIALNHCVKTYIDKVLEQKTNILFIRRPEDLEKPFFTLEIKDGFVRQCHGFNNCNIDKAEGLEKFLERYCKEKDIAFSEIQADRILAVG